MIFFIVLHKVYKSLPFILKKIKKSCWKTWYSHTHDITLHYWLLYIILYIIIHWINMYHLIIRKLLAKKNVLFQSWYVLSRMSEADGWGRGSTQTQHGQGNGFNETFGNLQFTLFWLYIFSFLLQVCKLIETAIFIVYKNFDITRNVN